MKKFYHIFDWSIDLELKDGREISFKGNLLEGFASIIVLILLIRILLFLI